MYVCMYVCMYVYTYVWMYVYYVCMYIMYVWMYVWIYVYYVCMYVCMHVYMGLVFTLTRSIQSPHHGVSDKTMNTARTAISTNTNLHASSWDEFAHYLYYRI
jgi:hypothetical protein